MPIRRWLILTCALLVALVHMPVLAQTTTDIDLPAQPLGPALNALAKATGTPIAAPADLVSGRQAPALKGRFAVQDALARLLAGSGLEARREGAGFLIQRAAPQSERSDQQLPEVKVQGSVDRPGDLPRPYAGGQVARGGQLGLLGNKDFMDTPFNQTTFTAQTIRNQQARTLADVIENDPSVHVVTRGVSQGADNLSIRGFTFNNADVSFNGLYGVAPTSNSTMTLESIERVEIFKGPNALLNGIAPNQSAAGAINLVPKRAGKAPLTEFTPTYASDGQWGGHVDVGRRFGADDRVGVRANAVYRKGDLAIDRQSQETQLLTVGIDFQGESVRLSGDFGYQFLRTDVTRRQVFLESGVAVPKAPENSLNWSQPWDFYENKNPFGVVRGEVDISQNVTAYLAAGAGARYGLFKNQDNFLADVQGTLIGDPFATSIREEARTAEGGVRASFDTGAVRHSVNLAMSVLRKESGFAFTFFPGSPPSNLFNPVFIPDPGLGGMPDPEDTPKSRVQNNSSVALADTLSFLEGNVQLTLGLRRQQVKSDGFNTVTGAPTTSYDKSATTPAVGFIVKPQKYLALYGNYIEGLQQGAAAPPTAVNAGEIFPPSKTKQVEAGAKFDFGTIAATISAFQIEQPSTFTDPTTNIFTQGGEQRNRGLELLAFGEPTRGIRMIGGVTYIDATLTKTQGGVNQGNDPVGVPAFRATLSGEWDVPGVPGLSLSGRANYTASAYLDQANTLEVPSYATFDLGARYSTRAGGIPVVIRAHVLNVFDKDYWVALGGPLWLGSPRQFLLSASFSF